MSSYPRTLSNVICGKQVTCRDPFFSRLTENASADSTFPLSIGNITNVGSSYLSTQSTSIQLYLTYKVFEDGIHTEGHESLYVFSASFPHPNSYLALYPDIFLAPKKPIKRLPTSIEITESTTVQDVKDQLAKQIGGIDPNRLGLFDSKNKILKDRRAYISQHAEVTSTKEIFVKDLGIQIPASGYSPS